MQLSIYLAPILSSEWQRHRSGVLQVGHHHGGDGEHEAGHDLLRVVVVLRVGEADAGAVDSHPAAPLYPGKDLLDLISIDLSLSKLNTSHSLINSNSHINKADLIMRAHMEKIMPSTFM